MTRSESVISYCNFYFQYFSLSKDKSRLGYDLVNINISHTSMSLKRSKMKLFSTWPFYWIISKSYNKIKKDGPSHVKCKTLKGSWVEKHSNIVTCSTKGSEVLTSLLWTAGEGGGGSDGTDKNEGGKSFILFQYWKYLWGLGISLYFLSKDWMDQSWSFV